MDTNAKVGYAVFIMLQCVMDMKFPIYLEPYLSSTFNPKYVEYISIIVHALQNPSLNGIVFDPMMLLLHDLFMTTRVTTTQWRVTNTKCVSLVRMDIRSKLKYPCPRIPINFIDGLVNEESGKLSHKFEKIVLKLSSVFEENSVFNEMLAHIPLKALKRMVFVDISPAAYMHVVARVQCKIGVGATKFDLLEKIRLYEIEKHKKLVRHYADLFRSRNFSFKENHPYKKSEILGAIQELEKEEKKLKEKQELKKQRRKENEEGRLRNLKLKNNKQSIGSEIITRRKRYVRRGRGKPSYRGRKAFRGRGFFKGGNKRRGQSYDSSYPN
jgi:hypothetical protein